jgi:hypothetical protein
MLWPGKERRWSHSTFGCSGGAVLSQLALQLSCQGRACSGGGMASASW